MSQPIIIPVIVTTRWQEAHAAPSLGRWRSLTQMLSDMVVNSSVYSPNAPIVDDLRTLAHVAHAHTLAMQPECEAA